MPPSSPRACSNGTRLTSFNPVADELVGPCRDDRGRVGVGGAAVRRVVLEPAVGGRVVRRRHDDAVGEPAREPDGLPAVRAEDRVRHGRGRRVAVAVVDEHLDAVGDEDLEGRPPGRLGQAVRVAADEERPVEALGGAVLDRSPASSRGCGPR